MVWVVRPANGDHGDTGIGLFVLHKIDLINYGQRIYREVKSHLTEYGFDSRFLLDTRYFSKDWRDPVVIRAATAAGYGDQTKKLYLFTQRRTV